MVTYATCVYLATLAMLICMVVAALVVVAAVFVAVAIDNCRLLVVSCLKLLTSDPRSASQNHLYFYGSSS